MLKTIGEELGKVLDQEITSSSVKVKILLDGLQPIIKETIVEFPDGREAIVYLDYKNLKNHCSHCHRLTHEKKFCPGVARKPDDQHHISTSKSASAHASKSNSRNYYTHHDNFTAPRSNSHISERSVIPQQFVNPAKRKLNHDAAKSRSPPARRTSPQRKSYAREDFSRSRGTQRNYHLQGAVQSPRYESRQGYHSSQQLQWREKSNSSTGNHVSPSEQSRARRPPLERNVTTPDPPTPPPLQTLYPRCSGMEVSSPPLPPPSKDQVMSELRDVTIQYISCPDPTESAARKIRVFKGETRNLMENTAMGIISAASGSEPPVFTSELQALKNLSSDPDLLVIPAAGPECPPAIPFKRGRGRPPLQKQTTKPIIKLLGTKSQKRNFTQGFPSKISVSKTGRKSGGQTTSKSLTSLSPADKQSLSANPKVTLIPATKKKKVDFQNLPTPFP